MTAAKELSKLAMHLPIEVLEDINKRIGDWIMGGGDHDDPYVWQQVRYAQHVAKLMKTK